MPPTKTHLFPLCALLITTTLSAAEPPIDHAQAANYFKQAEHLSRRDAGTLWGTPLYGPMLLVHPKTREIVANQADPEGRLHRRDAVWTGTLPENENVANTATDWSGERWTMLAWPLPEDRHQRATLMLHELFHRIQDDLDLPSTNPDNVHLDEMTGRLWLRLELAALRAAIDSEGADESRHTQSALIFRAQRHRLFEGAAAQEAALERHEGLAEYTGVTLSGRTTGDTLAHLHQKIAQASALPTLVRSFAYTTGPLYGLLLDRQGPAWRRQITTDNISPADLLARQRDITLPKDPHQEAEARLARYGGKAIREAEDRREQKRQQQLAEYRKLLVDGPVLVIQLEAMRVQFDPTNLKPLGEHGTVYPTLRIADNWGVLTVTGGALLHPTWSRVTVPAADLDAAHAAGTVESVGWTLDLAEGWQIVPGARSGDFALHAPPQLD